MKLLTLTYALTLNGVKSEPQNWEEGLSCQTDFQTSSFTYSLNNFWYLNPDDYVSTKEICFDKCLIEANRRNSAVCCTFNQQSLSGEAAEKQDQCWAADGPLEETGFVVATRDSYWNAKIIAPDPNAKIRLETGTSRPGGIGLQANFLELSLGALTSIIVLYS